MTDEIRVSRRDLEILLDGLGEAIEAELVEDLDEATALHERLTYVVVATT